MALPARWPWPLRRLSLFFALVIALVVLLLVAHPTTRSQGLELLGMPAASDFRVGPTYSTLTNTIAKLPQHNPDLPFPEGKNGRYVRFSSEANWIGWNNCLNERLMNAFLAYSTNRAYVFGEYWWAPQHYQFPRPEGSGDARTPMKALVGGPVVGDPWLPTGDEDTHPHPRSISTPWWDTICPPERRRVFDTQSIKPFLEGGVDNAAGSLIWSTWHELLLNAPESCVEVVYSANNTDMFPQIFDLRLWGSPRILDLWDSFSKSPISAQFRASPIAQSAVEANIGYGTFSGASLRFFPAWLYPHRDPFERMLAVHLRRGDYVEHCHNIVNWHAKYYGWAQLPSLPDVVAGRMPSEDDPEREAKVFAMCLPDVASVVRRIEEVRNEWAAQNGSALETLYLLTNSDHEFLDALLPALRYSPSTGLGWRTVVTTRDLHISTAEEQDVSLAIDMEIARRAKAFLGNPWSSFTSNVVHQRLVSGRGEASVRFW
ncbi:hypothetical protein HMN09_00936600 [Mycena chlorophos]|uniref:Uncharacterized protein n=1 Tax=Mycena chlorophos TaxID=658473 RepID=A0A8H6SKV2_MYCCL|nr:hypothetical protein HMN09_00936600 [Mycena chlorophos]